MTLGLAQACQFGLKPMGGDVFQELVFNGETSTGQIHLGQAVTPNFIFGMGKKVAHVIRVGRRNLNPLALPMRFWRYIVSTSLAFQTYFEPFSLA